MGEKSVFSVDTFKNMAKSGLDKIDVGSLKDKASGAGTVIKDKAGIAGEVIKEKAVELKDAAVQTKDDIAEKLTELDRMLEEEITKYNDAYTLMNDKGIRLFVERSRAIDTIENIKALINSIANTPKSFEEDFSIIETNRKKFTDSCEFADRELDAARKMAGGAGAAIAAGASVAFMAPTAAMWIATTFGTASTGAAISTLSGAAATNAALAWLGGGAVASGGGGIAAGNALLAMAGPVGWTIAGATLLSSIILFAKKRVKLNAEKNEEIEKVKKNTETIKETDEKIKVLLDETHSIREKLNDFFHAVLKLYGQDYNTFTNEDKVQLGALVNNTMALSAMLNKNID
jgi:hypothetical protein